MYKIIIADDHPFLREGLKVAIKEMAGLDVTGTVGDGISLLSEVARLKPHLVILDLNMPGLDGIGSLRRMKKDFPLVKVLILTNYNQPELVLEVKNLGADGFLVKNSPVSDLEEAIVKLLAGERFFPAPESRTHDISKGFFIDDFLKKYQLTKREVTIIKMVCKEMSSREMAAALSLSELTITTHRRNIMRKLEVSNVAGLINFAAKHHLI
jgi:DNA-binding NarL/FixJ family response regulator